MRSIRFGLLPCLAAVSPLALGQSNPLLPFAPADPLPAISLQSLGSVRFNGSMLDPSITAYPLNAPPIGGFIPRVVFGLTNEHSSEDFDWYTYSSSLPFNTTLPTPATPRYLVATFDTGAQLHLINNSAALAFDLAGNNMEGTSVQEIIGANGSEFGVASDALGIYMTGFQNVTGTAGGNITVAPGSLKGHYNSSIVVVDPGSNLPNIIGAPMASLYQTRIANSTTRHLTVGANTYKSPDVSFFSEGTPIPNGYSRLTLNAVPAGDFTDPPSYIPNFTTFDHDNPQTATFWGSLLATATVTNNGTLTNTTQFLFDTGAEVSVLSEDTANTMGIFLAGPEPTPPDFFVDIDGVGGTTVQKPGFFIQQLGFTTNGGFVNYTNVPIIVIDLPDPRDPQHAILPGLIGMNLFHDRDLIIDTTGVPYVYFGPVLTPQWNTDGNGNWSEDLKWTMGSPQEVDAPANFLGAITAARTITVDGAGFTCGSMKFDNVHRYTIDGPGTIALQPFIGSSTIEVVNGSHTINAPMSLLANTLVKVTPAGSTLTISNDVNGGTATLTKSGTGMLEMKNVRAAGVAVNNGALRIIPNGGNAGTSKVQSVTVAAGAKVDMTDNDMVVDYTGASPITTIAGLIQTGYASGAWTGNGLTSSSAAMAASTSLKTALGFAEATDLFTTFPNVFSGQPIDATSVLIRYTAAGDATLDGTVNSADFNLLASNFGSSGKRWSQGDFTYDTVVNSADFNVLAANFGQSVPSGPGGAVPEPAALSLLAPAALLFRRRKH